MENKMMISPSQLVKLADDECQILKHSIQWGETIDPSVVAMQALFHNTNQGNNDLFKTLAASLSTLTKMHQFSSYDKHQGGDGSLSGRHFHYNRACSLCNTTINKRQRVLVISLK